jgi:prepilin-type N-terminal cleavage/methylation domain-containing protein
MTLRRTARRPGFTLLELLLASAIGVLLMGALYFAMDVVLRQTDRGREEVEKNDTARAIVNRMTIDFNGITGPMPPRSGGIADSSAAASAATGSTGTAGTTGAAATAAPATTTTPATSTTTTDPTATTTDPTDPTQTPAATGANLPFGCGVVGTDKQVTLFVGRVPKGLSDPGTDPTLLMPTDLRKVTYYLASDGKGLCRQESPWVTADGIWNTTDPDRTNELLDMVAEEITDITFEYFDGTNWQTSWDGTMANLDEKSLMGPPRAIRVTLVIEKTGSNGEKINQTVRHVLPIRAANGLIPVLPPTDTTGTTGTTGTGGM